MHAYVYNTYCTQWSKLLCLKYLDKSSISVSSERLILFLQTNYYGSKCQKTETINCCLDAYKINSRNNSYGTKNKVLISMHCVHYAACMLDPNTCCLHLHDNLKIDICQPIVLSSTNPFKGLKMSWVDFAMPC